MVLRIFLAAVLSAQVALADQNHPDLTRLFDQLGEAEGILESRRIEAEIWQRWLLPPQDSPHQELMDQVQQAIATRQIGAGLAKADDLLEFHPEFAEAWNKRATLYFMAGQLDQSVSDIIQTLTLEPRHFGALSGLLQILEARGDYARAIKVVAQLRQIAPAGQDFDTIERRLRDRLNEKAT